MEKGIQYISKEYLKRCEEATPDQILQFLENYRKLISSAYGKEQLIQHKIESSVLKTEKSEEQRASK